MQNQGPHRGQRISEAGMPLYDARAAVILIHGRGATAESILPLADELEQEGVSFLAPQAAGNTWYPYSFLAPNEQNEPGLSSGLQSVEDVRMKIERAGVPNGRIVVMGFSQGACLALEYVARNPRRYGGAVAFSGGLIGTGSRHGGERPDDKLFEYEGSLQGTPVFLGCSDVDPHIPVGRVHTSADVLKRLGGAMTVRIYEGMAHTINDDEITFARNLLADLAADRDAS